MKKKIKNTLQIIYKEENKNIFKKIRTLHFFLIECKYHIALKPEALWLKAFALISFYFRNDLKLVCTTFTAEPDFLDEQYTQPVSQSKH